jgi:hypothetical protein
MRQAVSMTIPSRAALIGCTVAAAVAAIQPWLMLALGEANVSTLNTLNDDAEIAARMFTALLVFMPPMFISYWIATRAVAATAPTLASFAAFAFALWFALELLPRSFDLWVVHARWLPRFEEADAMGRAALEQQYASYRDANFALGFVRRHALLTGQACLAVGVWRSGLIGRLLAIAFGLSVLRLLLGSLAIYGGFTELNAIADPMYFATAGALYPLLAVWAWKLARIHP